MLGLLEFFSPPQSVGQRIAPILWLCAGGIFVCAVIFQTAKKLRSTGTVFRIEDAIGKEGIIYQRIPAGGTGKVSVSLNDFTHEIEAISSSQADIPSFTPVQIIKKVDEKTVIVVQTK